MVVTELTGLSGETEVGHRGNGDVGIFGVEGEAFRPGVFGLVLELQRQRLVLEVGKAGLGRDWGAAETTSLKRMLVMLSTATPTQLTEQPANSLALPSCAWS